MRFWVVMWCVLGLGASACLTPRSFALQQMAAPIGRGATEVSVFGGVGYAAQTNPPVGATQGSEPVTNQVQNRAFALPGAEANIQQGLSQHLALNVHASSAGIQPGLKITVNRSKTAHFAIMPAIALGYASFGSSTYQSRVDGRLTEVSPMSTTSFSFLGGFKMLVSHRSGAYGGVGYDLMLHRMLTQSAPSTAVDRTDTLSLTVSHQISLAVGFDIALGRVHLRPEIAAAVYPGISQSFSTRVGSTSAELAVSGGFGWALMPGLGIAVATEAKPDEVEESVKPENEGDEDEEQVQTPQKRRDSEEDEDDDSARKKRRPVEEDD